MQPILAKLGQMDVPDDKIAERLDASVEDILAQAAKPVPVSNDGADIDAAIVASRAKLCDLDTTGALEVLQAKLDEEERERTRRRVPLLKERAAVESLGFDYDAAKKTLAEVTRLAPDDVWVFIGLGDLYWFTGQLDEAAKAFRGAEEAARRRGDERGLSVSFNGIGDVQKAQGDLAGALKSYEADRVITERLAKSNRGKALLQRDLSVSYEKIGDVQKEQGDLEGARKSYNVSLTIAKRLAKSKSRNAEWKRDLSVSYEKIGDVQKEQGDLEGARKSYNASLAIRGSLAKSNRGKALLQRDLSVSYEKIGDVQKEQGDLAGALKSYSDSLDIRNSLVKSDRGNGGWQLGLFCKIRRATLPGHRGNAQHDLAECFCKLASVHRQSGDNAKARAALRQGQAIMARLTKLSPDNAEWKTDLARCNRQIAELAER